VKKLYENWSKLWHTRYYCGKVFIRKNHQVSNLQKKEKEKGKGKGKEKTDYFFYLLVGATNLNGTIVGDTVFDLGSTLVGSGSLFGR
jgi:hypothetical protein